MKLKSEISKNNIFITILIMIGVVHGDELGYIFYANFYKNKPAPGSDIEKKTNEMVEMWTNFAKERWKKKIYTL